MVENKMSNDEVRALILIGSVKKAKDLTQAGIVLISRFQQDLLLRGLIDYASGTKAWKITPIGRRFLSQKIAHSSV